MEECQLWNAREDNGHVADPVPHPSAGMYMVGVSEADTMTYKEFSDTDLIVCPSCWVKPAGVHLEMDQRPLIPLFPDDPEFASFQEPDRVTGYVLACCGYRPDRLEWVALETPPSWGMARPAFVQVWFVREYLEMKR